MPHTEDLEPPIRAMIDATNAGDSDAFLQAFADDATIDDWGRTFTGRDEIARWNDNGGGSFVVDVDGARIARLVIRG